MATPTLTTIEPDNGHPSGKYLLSITGTNFTVPALPAATGRVTAPAATVEVLVNGRLATDTRVFSSTFLTCLAPAFRGDPADLSSDPGLDVDVVIRNVGPPIESATFTDAFTYRRTDLTRSEGVLRNVLRTLVLELRRQVIENVQTSRQVDYDANAGDGLDIVEWASMPGIAVYGPDMVEDMVRRDYAQSNTQDLVAMEYVKYHPRRHVTLRFTADILAENYNEYLALAQEFTRFFLVNPTLAVLSDDTDPTSDEVELEVFLTKEPARSGAANEAATFTGTASFEVHGVQIDDDDKIPVRWGRVLEDPDTDLFLQAEEQS